MVTKSNTPVPPTHTVPKKMPGIEPATVVGGANAKTLSQAGSDLTNKDRTGDNKFTLPEKVTQQEIRDGSFKYGGGRSAGNRPLPDAVLKNVDD